METNVFLLILSVVLPVKWKAWISIPGDVSFPSPPPILYSNIDFFMALRGEENHKEQEFIHAVHDSALF